MVVWVGGVWVVCEVCYGVFYVVFVVVFWEVIVYVVVVVFFVVLCGVDDDFGDVE